jgi:hypothetical protein
LNGAPYHVPSVIGQKYRSSIRGKFHAEMLVVICVDRLADSPQNQIKEGTCGRARKLSSAPEHRAA